MESKPNPNALLDLANERLAAALRLHQDTSSKLIIADAEAAIAGKAVKQLREQLAELEATNEKLRTAAHQARKKKT